nr:ParB/RepB/Spo0J family partition protein [Arthrobacter sp.]
MPEKRRGLGRGLGALIPSSAEQQDGSASNGGTRVAERGRPVDLFFPSPEPKESAENDDSGTQGARARTAPGRTSINKDALTAPSKRTSGRAQAAVKRGPAAKPAKPKAGASVKTGGKTAADKVQEDSAVADAAVHEVATEPADDRTPSTASVDLAADTQPTLAAASGEATDSEAAQVSVGDSGHSVDEKNDSIEVEASSSVIAEDEDVSGVDVPRETLREVPGARFAELPIDSIHPNRKQPRTVFDEDEMAELVHSVREIGVLQPVVVRASSEGGEHAYELVMGERRWRASKEAGLETVPAIIRDTTDDDLLRDALLENLHRSQLNPLEEAAAYQQLLEDFGCSQEELAVRIGRSRPQISNTLRLMKLPPLVQRRLAAGVLSAGHARALLGLSDPAEMEKLAQRIVAEGLSVRSTEEIVAMSDGLRRPTKPSNPRAGARHERLDYLATSLSDRLDTNVKITLGAKKGRVSIEFASVDDLNRIMGVLTPSS